MIKQGLCEEEHDSFYSEEFRTRPIVDAYMIRQVVLDVDGFLKSYVVARYTRMFAGERHFLGHDNNNRRQVHHHAALPFGRRWNGMIMHRPNSRGSKNNVMNS
jgi:hypothetical protein